MLFNVPQFTDIEDKIVGPFTAKQIGWMVGGGVVIFLAWSLFDSQTFIVIAIIIALIFGALAFYRPYNQPLINLVFSGISFFIRPKMYVWRRVYDTMQGVRKSTNAPKITAKRVDRKNLDYSKIEEISKILDKR
jgi:hypothetical protein